MLRRVFHGTGCLLLEGSVSRYMKQFPNVKETYTSDGKIPGKRFIQESILAETRKLQKGTR
jgi:gamma-glutamyltranspeptidase/glutathione hydrolase